MTMLREEWNRIAEMDYEAELTREQDLLRELRRETSQLIASAGRRKKELRKAALCGRLRHLFGGFW